MGARLLVIGDYPILFWQVMKLLKKRGVPADFAYSPGNGKMAALLHDFRGSKPLNLKDEATQDAIIKGYDMVLSLYCEQIFPARLVQGVRCINMHPSFMPYNRGWDPNVFGIINKLPSGVTIHEMDDQLDHGAIITQEKIEVGALDTGRTVSDRLIDTGMVMLEGMLDPLLRHTYTTRPMEGTGNINTKRDLAELRRLDLDGIGTLQEHVDVLRALSDGWENPAYFRNGRGEKRFMEINLVRGNMEKGKSGARCHSCLDSKHKGTFGEHLEWMGAFSNGRNRMACFSDRVEGQISIGLCLLIEKAQTLSLAG